MQSITFSVKKLTEQTSSIHYFRWDMTCFILSTFNFIILTQDIKMFH